MASCRDYSVDEDGISAKPRYQVHRNACGLYERLFREESLLCLGALVPSPVRSPTLGYL